MNPFFIISDLADIEGSWLETLVIINLIIVLNIWFLTCVPNISFLAYLEECQELPCHHQWLEGHWRFLTGVMGHPWPQNCYWHWIHNLCAKFQHSSMIRSVSRSTLSSSVTWRILRVADQRHAGHGSFLTFCLFLTFDTQPLCKISAF